VMVHCTRFQRENGPEVTEKIWIPGKMMLGRNFH
jgi:hypothetical protein